MVCITGDKFIINGYIENDPLSEENLNKTLETIHEIRLSFPNKSIWLYSGYTLGELIKYDNVSIPLESYLRKDEYELYTKRHQILENVDVLVDGKYIDSQRNPSKKWAGSDNQQVIDTRQSLEKGEIVLWCK